MNVTQAPDFLMTLHEYKKENDTGKYETDFVKEIPAISNISTTILA